MLDRCSRPIARRGDIHMIEVLAFTGDLKVGLRLRDVKSGFAGPEAHSEESPGIHATHKRRTAPASDLVGSGTRHRQRCREGARMPAKPKDYPKHALHPGAKALCRA